MTGCPRTVLELENLFRTEIACRDYLEDLRWPAGFRCPRCRATKAWRTKRGLWACGSCGYQCSVTAGTIFQDSRLPLTTWFRAIWCVTSQKNGASALGVQRVLGLGSYHTAWAWLHKLRRAMVRPGRDRLREAVEVDETFVGGRKASRPGGSARGKKAVVVIAVERRGRAMGRVRMRRVRDRSTDSLASFVQECVEPGAVVVTDGLNAYRALGDQGYRLERRVQLDANPWDEEALLPRVHRVASLLKRWLLGTHQGAVRRRHLDYYLDEFTFRFNRRTSSHRGMLFRRLLENAVQVEPVPYKRLVRGSRLRSRRPRLESPEVQRLQ